MRPGSYAFATAVCVALLATVVHADELSPLEPPDTARYLRWGPFRVRPGLTIPAIGYDDNVYAVTDETAALDPGSKVGDYFVALSPRLQGLVLFGHRAFMTFDERMDFYLYAKNSGLDYFNQYGKARLTIPFRRVGIYWDTGYDRTRDRPYDAQNIRPIRKYYPFGLGLVTKFGWRTDSELGWFRNRYNAEDPDAPPPPGPCNDLDLSGCSINQLNNRTEEGGLIKARYLVFGRMRVLLNLSQRTITFDDASVGAQRNGKEERQLVGLDFGLGGRLFGTFHIGHALFNLDAPAATDFNGPVGDVALGYNFGSSGSRLTLTGARDVRYTVYNATPLYVYTGADLTLIKYFTRFIGMELSAGRSQLDFLGTARIDNDISGVAGVRFRFSENDLGRRVEYAFRYTRWVVNSSQDSLDQNRGTFGFGVTVGY